MSILYILGVFMVAALFLWVVNGPSKVTEPFRTGFNILVLVALAIGLLYGFGVIQTCNPVIPKVR